ncbi:hypothetical protein CAL7716_065140 [Calothrix sp. PCC 7716]|nr:hypothetical protein CAL7716_065140 [Calothrix sp. PCC 7716]
MHFMTINEFRYVIGVQEEILLGLQLWQAKITEYINLYYQGDIENAKNTIFYGCVSKTRELYSYLLSRPEDYRSAIDDQGLLACACIIQPTDIYLDNGEVLQGLEIEHLTNSPWNTLLYPQPETRKGSATSLVEELVKESQALGFSGILKAVTVPSVREFYKNIGFVEDNGTGWMTLTSDAAESFLNIQLLRRRNNHE